MTIYFAIYSIYFLEFEAFIKAYKYSKFPKRTVPLKYHRIDSVYELLRIRESSRIVNGIRYFSRYTRFFLLSNSEFDTAALINIAKRKTPAIVFTPLLLISLFTLDCSPRSYRSRKRYRATTTH